MNAGQPIALFTVDRLPAGCGVSVDMEVDDDNDGALVSRLRFVAVDRHGRESVPSGWFRWEGEAVVLAWAAFEWKPS